MATQLTDGINNVPVDATSKGVLVQPSKVITQAGYTLLAGMIDPGTVLGTPTVRAPLVSIDERLSVGSDVMMLVDSFNSTAQNTGIWQNNLTTMTLTYSGGYAFLNAGGSLASGAFAVLKSYRSFTMYQAGGIKAEFRGYLTQTPQTNNTVYIGLGLPGTTAAPTDGVYFQYDATGVLKGVVNFNGTLATSAALTAPSANASHEFAIVVTDDNSEFWIDGVLVATVSLPTGATLMTLSDSCYVFVQNTNTGATGAAQGVKIAFISVTQLDVAGAKPWSHQMCAQGFMASQGQDGGTLGTTALFSNSLAIGAGAVLTNTTAAAGSGLGGQFTVQPTLAAGTDGILCSYQNPTLSVNITGRILYITGVKIQGMVTAALTGGPGVFAYSLAYGHTSVSLATTEAAATKAPRRIPLGMDTFAATAAIGITNPAIYMPFNSPVVINPGEFVAITMKNLAGTAFTGTTGLITYIVTFDGYWE